VARCTATSRLLAVGMSRRVVHEDTFGQGFRGPKSFSMARQLGPFWGGGPRVLLRASPTLFSGLGGIAGADRRQQKDFAVSTEGLRSAGARAARQQTCRGRAGCRWAPTRGWRGGGFRGRTVGRRLLGVEAQTGGWLAMKGGQGSFRTASSVASRVVCSLTKKIERAPGLVPWRSSASAVRHGAVAIGRHWFLRPRRRAALKGEMLIGLSPPRGRTKIRDMFFS